ncbi:histidine--trna ligase [Quercus suber]|uniref:histidine--tRNA ligase n=1 Tax=Quercus suber TaxID=58331 RepID=A0AAW0LWC8_QUESU
MGFGIKLNHRKLLDGMLDICGVPPEKFRTTCSSIDKLDKQPFEQIKKEMVEEKGLSADEIGTFVKERGQPLELLSKLKQQGSKFLGHNGSVDALNDLEILFKALKVSKCIDKVVFDLSLARGLDYYTGVIFEAVFKGDAQVSELWNAKVKAEYFVNKRVIKHIDHARESRISWMVIVGEREMNEGIVILKDIEAAKEDKIPRSSLVEELKRRGKGRGFGEESCSHTLEAEAEVEALDFFSLPSPIVASLSSSKRVIKHIDRARESRIPWMVIVGEREMNEGIVILKDIEAAKEDKIPRSSLVEELKRRLNP